MKITVNKKVKSTKGLMVVPVFKENLKKPAKIYPQTIKKFLEKRVKAKEFNAKKLELLPTYIEDKKLPEKIALLGCGKKDKFKGRKARELGGKLGKYAKSSDSEILTILILPEMAEYVEELLEGILMGQYRIDQYKTSKKTKKPKHEIEKIDLIIEKSPKNIKKQIEKARIISMGVEFTKDLINAPSDKVDGDYLANEAKKLARENSYKFINLDQKKLEKMGCGGILAVNRGARKQARCLVLEYEGAKNKREKPIIIVGKGIIFDTGGYNLKPTKYIETMHQDMAGAATVIGLFSVLEKLGIKKNIIGLVPIAENLVSAEAYRPSDIIKMYSGLTVEITNTDAEGRLILADAIAYGAEMKPQSIITIATLTGAVTVAVGDRYAGLFSNNLKLRKNLYKAGREVDDLGWPLPIHGDYKKKMKSDIADIRNVDNGTSAKAGASKAAAFLEKFVDKNSWCHIDIGGTAYSDDPREFQHKGATAHGLRMLIRFLEK